MSRLAKGLEDRESGDVHPHEEAVAIFYPVIYGVLTVDKEGPRPWRRSPDTQQ